MLNRTLIAGLLACSLPAHCLRADEANDDDSGKKRAVIVVEARASEGDEAEEVEVEVHQQPAQPRLWLGIALKSVEGDLAAFLGGAKGVLIDQVQPDSPAAKAGLQQGDLLLSVGDKELTGPQDLLEVMGSTSEGVALKLKLLRKAEKLEIEVTPQVRAKSDAHAAGTPGAFRIENLSEDVLKGRPIPGADGQVYMFRFGDPSVVTLPDNVQLKGNIAIHMVKEDKGEKVEVKIAKKPESPAEITVTRGDDVQTFSEEQLDELPEDVRDWVKSAISGKKSGAWIGARGFSAVGPDGKPLILRGMPELKGLPRAEWNEKIEGNVDVNKLIEELTSSAKVQANEAIKKALEQAGLSADQAAQQAKELAQKYVEQARELAKQKSQAGQEYLKAAEEHAKALAEKGKRGEVHQHAQSEQIAELKAMIEQLQKEIAELKNK